MTLLLRLIGCNEDIVAVIDCFVDMVTLIGCNDNTVAVMGSLIL